jgi:hypothetical protein
VIVIVIFVSKHGSTSVVVNTSTTTPTSPEPSPSTIPVPQVPTFTPSDDLPLMNFKLIDLKQSPKPVNVTRPNFPGNINYNFLTKNGFIIHTNGNDPTKQSTVSTTSFIVNTFAYGLSLPLQPRVDQDQRYTVFSGTYVYKNMVASVSWIMNPSIPLPVPNTYETQLFEFASNTWNAYGTRLYQDLVIPIGFYQSNETIYLIGTNQKNQMFVYKNDVSAQQFFLHVDDGYNFEQDSMSLWGNGSIASATGTVVLGTWLNFEESYIYTFLFSKGDWKSNVFKQKVCSADEAITNVKIDDFAEHLVVGIVNRDTLMGRLLLFQFSEGNWVQTAEVGDSQNTIISVDIVSSGKLVSLNTSKYSKIYRVKMNTGELYTDTTSIPYSGVVPILANLEVPQYIGPQLFESPNDNLIYQMTGSTNNELSIFEWDF